MSATLYAPALTGELDRVHPTACHSCRGMAAECKVPDGESAVGMCWLCAHMVVDHGANPRDAARLLPDNGCGCHPKQIFPIHVLNSRARTGGEFATWDAFEAAMRLEKRGVVATERGASREARDQPRRSHRADSGRARTPRA